MPTTKLSARAINWIAVLGAADILAWILTIHAHATYRRTTASAPSVMPLGQLLGWIISIGLLILIVMILLGSRQQSRWNNPDRH